MDIASDLNAQIESHKTIQRLESENSDLRSRLSAVEKESRDRGLMLLHYHDQLQRKLGAIIDTPESQRFAMLGRIRKEQEES